LAIQTKLASNRYFTSTVSNNPTAKVQKFFSVFELCSVSMSLYEYQN